MADPEKATAAAEEDESCSEEEAGGTKMKAATTSLLQDPAMLAAMQNHLGGLVGQVRSLCTHGTINGCRHE